MLAVLPETQRALSFLFVALSSGLSRLERLLS
jgi:hypothetical protein